MTKRKFYDTMGEASSGTTTELMRERRVHASAALQWEDPNPRDELIEELYGLVEELLHRIEKLEARR
jgi:hypothetical protein